MFPVNTTVAGSRPVLSNGNRPRSTPFGTTPRRSVAPIASRSTLETTDAPSTAVQSRRS